MIIRQKQFEKLQEAADKNFVERLVAYLQEQHSTVVVELSSDKFVVGDIPIKTLRLLVSKGIDQARKYGLTWESSLTSFVVMMFVTSPDFHLYPAIHAILQDENIEANARIDQLGENVTDAEWEEVKQNYNSHAWELND